MDVNSSYEREHNHVKRTLALFILTSTYPAERTFFARPFGWVESLPIPLPRRSRLPLRSKEIHISTSLPFDIDGMAIIITQNILLYNLCMCENCESWIRPNPFTSWAKLKLNKICHSLGGLSKSSLNIVYCQMRKKLVQI